jgi:hypothetical protein
VWLNGYYYSCWKNNATQVRDGGVSSIFVNCCYITDTFYQMLFARVVSAQRLLQLLEEQRDADVV